MPQLPYALHPESVKRNWIERNPLWKIPLGFLIGVLLMALFGAVPLGIMNASFRNSDVYQQAMAQAQANAQVREQIGEPIKAGWFIWGQLKIGGTTGRANFSIPISGPAGKGRIRVVAYKDGLWKFSCLQVYVEGPPRAIDLLSVQTPQERDF